MPHVNPRRRQVAGAAGLAVSLALGLAAVGGVGPAASAPPVADCAVPFPVADLAVGDDLHGLTVTSGVTPEPFDAKVLGTLEDGIAPDLDMVIVKVDPTGLGIDPDEVKGIWQGMSGSPVYADDGRLVGAISYGLSLQQSWVAGVTPYEEMDDYLGTEPLGRVAASHSRMSKRLAARVASAAGVTTGQAAKGFVQLPMPLAVAGVPSRFLHPSAKKVAAHPWLRTDTYAAGRAGFASDAVAETMVAGGNLAAAMSTGDVLMAGIGTVTSVCDDDVVGFGHPMNFTGDSTMTLHPADTIYIQGDAPSFKVANIGAPVGTVFGDHMSGITGHFGALPESTSVSSTVNWGSRSRTGTSYVSTGTADDIAFINYIQGAINHQRVIDGASPGSEVLTMTVHGRDASTKPFTLSFGDRYLADYDLSDEVGMFTASMAASIAYIPGVSIDSIATTGTATADTTNYRIKRVEQKRAGKWVAVTSSNPAVAKAGGSLAVRAVLKDGNDVIELPFTFAVPKKASGRFAMLGLAGGRSTVINFGNSVSSAQKALKSAVRSDTVRAQFGRVTHNDVADFGDDDFFGFFRGGKPPRPKPANFLMTKKSARADAVMSGAKLVPVLIR
jgi:hypothetical protein